MTWVDGLIFGVLLLALFNGYRRGAVIQLFSWGGFVLGLFAGGFAALLIVNAFHPGSAGARVGVSLGAFLVIAFLVEGLIALGGAKLARKIVAESARKANAITGSVVAMIMVLIVAWLVTPITRRVPEVAAAVKGSAILRFADAILPGSPPNMLSALGGLLDRTGFPEVFATLNPSLAPGVDPPPAALARDRQVLAAARLTFKIQGKGCGGVVNGSGFPIREDTVVTAAHVVAGTSDTKVIEASDAGGSSFDARVVYMDTETDIAILRVGRLPNELLELSTQPAAFKTDGAAIGYPGGGKRTISVARVRTRTDARGQDIYSQRSVFREIYVLRAVVRQGNSGGPLVDTAGVVRGMIFAASATEAEESYALAETEVRDALRQAAGRNKQIDTGRCAI
ncbi:MAG TPA: MarP family serine protease [Actinomycetota bacterium]